MIVNILNNYLANLLMIGMIEDTEYANNNIKRIEDQNRSALAAG
jgi:hypothetical protein